MIYLLSMLSILKTRVCFFITREEGDYPAYKRRCSGVYSALALVVQYHKFTKVVNKYNKARKKYKVSLREEDG